MGEPADKRINVSFNKSLFRKDLEGHEVWSGVKSFSYDPPGERSTHVYAEPSAQPHQHKMRIAINTPAPQSIEPARKSHFPRASEGYFAFFEPSHVEIHDLNSQHFFGRRIPTYTGGGNYLFQ